MGKIKIKDLDLYYGDFHALKNINLDIEANKITAFIDREHTVFVQKQSLMISWRSLSAMRQSGMNAKIV